MSGAGVNAGAGEGTNARAAAAEIVCRWLETGAFPDRMVDRVTVDRGFVTEVVYGVVKWKRELEWVLKQCSAHLPPAPLRAYVLVGLYQILHLDHVEIYAAVNETVAGVKARFPRSQADFVNAVLRRVAREAQGIAEALTRQPLAVRASHPEELVRRWQRQFGDTDAAALCAWDNSVPPVTLRVYRRAGGMAAFLARLAAAGVAAQPHPFDPERFCTLPRRTAPDRVPGFNEGWFGVQDPSTALAVDLLDPQPQEQVLDACAAPGGKTVALVDHMGGASGVIAMDLHEDRLVMLRETLRRAGCQDVKVVQGDMAACGPRGPGVAGLEAQTFDAILLDVPCMNTGVLRRRSDARWRFSLERMTTLVARQRAILGGAAERLKPGGRFVYSTCSLEPEEDESLIAAWLRHRPQFTLVRQKKLMPVHDGVDGAYAALVVAVSAKS